MKIVLEGYIDVPEADIAAVRAELPNHIMLTRQEFGCLVFTVNQDPQCNTRFRVYEEFLSQEAFDAHQKRVSESQWGCVSAKAERSYSIKYIGDH